LIINSFLILGIFVFVNSHQFTVSHWRRKLWACSCQPLYRPAEANCKMLQWSVTKLTDFPQNWFHIHSCGLHRNANPLEFLLPVFSPIIHLHINIDLWLIVIRQVEVKMGSENTKIKNEVSTTNKMITILVYKDFLAFLLS
jgi:hypothetical protein